jgi:membrane protein implicated in regulation of membrane protease activity
VNAWADDGSARVQYRGSTWIARPAPGAARQAGEHRIVAVEGTWLVLEPVVKP